jgi:hypothetical protein
MKGRKLYLLCGVSGSGKTWVCKKLTNKYNYVPHDLNFANIYQAISIAASKSSNPIITECPFGERIQREALEKLGFEVIPLFIVLDSDLAALRYFEREGKKIYKSAYKRATSIVNRALEWKAQFGSSKEIFDHLNNLI